MPSATPRRANAQCGALVLQPPTGGSGVGLSPHRLRLPICNLGRAYMMEGQRWRAQINQGWASRGRVESVVYCIRCIVYTLYSCFRCIRRRRAGAMSVRCIVCIRWFRALPSAFLYRLVYTARRTRSLAQLCGISSFYRSPVVPNAPWRSPTPRSSLNQSMGDHQDLPACCALSTLTRPLYSALYSETTAV